MVIRHHYKEAITFSLKELMQTYPTVQNVSAPKHRAPNSPGAEMYRRQNVSASKRLCAKTRRQNVGAKTSAPKRRRQNVVDPGREGYDDDDEDCTYACICYSFLITRITITFRRKLWADFFSRFATLL